MSDAPEPKKARENKPVPAARTPNHIPRYTVVGKIEFDMTKQEMDGIRRKIDKCGTRTPAELKIANNAWFDTKPGRATP